MTTAILDRVPVEQITAQARQVGFWRTLLAVLAGLLFGLGWLTARFLGGLWLVLVWCAVAVRVGWQEGRGNARRTG